MAIDSIGANRNFIAKQASFINKQNKAEQKKEDISLDKFERRVQREEIKYERSQIRKAKKNQTSPEVPVVDQPVKPTPVEPVADEKDLNSYAQKYVALYEKNSGRTLSEEERAAKVSQVAEFYSEPSRANRLENLVDQLSI